ADHNSLPLPQEASLGPRQPRTTPDGQLPLPLSGPRPPPLLRPPPPPRPDPQRPDRPPPQGLLHPIVHRHLEEARLGFNRIAELDSDAFVGLPRLEALDLSGNRLGRLRRGTFRDLPSLRTLNLCCNRIESVPDDAFHHLPSLAYLDLSRNRIGEFSMEAVVNNDIGRFSAGKGESSLLLLDLRDNRLQELSWLEGLTDLERLLLSDNELSRIDSRRFANLQSLLTLQLDGNSIATVEPDAFKGLLRLQVLDLSRNAVETLPAAAFASLVSLRVLRLAGNRLRSLAPDAFQNTLLERLDLSRNDFSFVPSLALGAVGASLRRLDLSRNAVEHVDAASLAACPVLTHLDVSHNKILVVPPDSFAMVPNLVVVNLSHNLLEEVDENLFQETRNLMVLNLAETKLKRIPAFGPSVPLRVLDVSRNAIAELRSESVLPDLVELVASRNPVQKLQSWSWAPQLQTLDVSDCPVSSLTRDSFRGLGRLRRLKLLGMESLRRLDADALEALKGLEELEIQTCPQIERYRFRLGSLLSRVYNLRELVVWVTEDSLVDQLAGTAATRLEKLGIRGVNLTSISPQAFKDVTQSRVLSLSISGTGLSRLPAGLLRHLPDATFLTLHLNDNALRSIQSEVLYGEEEDWTVRGSRVAPGGVWLEGNPLECDCHLLWYSRWLRRWGRESMQARGKASTAVMGQ
ncbi:unnamed protein product, partial [Darwinula stevensoni]